MSIHLPTCETCKFWGHAHRRDGKYRANCLRYPPQCHANGGAEWPVTLGNDACGEHKPVEVDA